MNQIILSKYKNIYLTWARVVSKKILFLFCTLTLFKAYHTYGINIARIIECRLLHKTDIETLKSSSKKVVEKLDNENEILCTHNTNINKSENIQREWHFVNITSIFICNCLPSLVLVTFDSFSNRPKLNNCKRNFGLSIE